MAAATVAATVAASEDSGAGAGPGTGAGTGVNAGAGAATEALWPEALRQLVRGMPSLGGVLRAVPMEAAEGIEQVEEQAGAAEAGEMAAAPLLLPLSEVQLVH